MRSKITDVQIKHWLRLRKNVAKAQGEVPGLTLTVSGAGTAAWILRYRFNDRQLEVTLGRYPEYSIADAKSKAIEARRMVMDGIDPAREKRKNKVTRAADKSFKALALDYEKKVLPGMVASTVEARQYHIQSWLIPRLGNIAARDITPADVVGLIEAAGERSYSATVQIFGTLTAIFDHGIARSIISTNPSRGIKVAAVLGKAPEKKPRVMLTEDELRQLLPALPNDRNGMVIRLLLITAVRINELLRAEWANVDLERAEWTIPDDNSKTGKGFVIPLPPVAVDLFKRLQAFACGSPFVLPGQGRSRKATMDPNTVLAAIGRLRKQLPEVRKFSPHDLRSTCRSHLSSLGIPVIVAERCLNHTLGGIVAVYDQHDYLDERRRALTLWADFLDACESDQAWAASSSNAVPIPQRAERR